MGLAGEVPRRLTRCLRSRLEAWQQEKTLDHLAQVLKARNSTREFGAKNLIVIKRSFVLEDPLWASSPDPQVSGYRIWIPATVLSQSVFNDHMCSNF